YGGDILHSTPDALSLPQAVDRGTGRRIRHLGFKRPAASKTSTTNDPTDA
ncbi:MAG: hypothetical protein HOK90_01805, partial [Gemmatimonadetes bacterium]|nr:hypothetical protein [Gemmatimonadota bacterium]